MQDTPQIVMDRKGREQKASGCALAEARRLLINGFADQVVDDVAIETLRTWIIDRLGHGDA